MAVTAQGAGAFPPPPPPPVEDLGDDDFEAEDGEESNAEIYGEGEVAMPVESARATTPSRSPRLPPLEEFPPIVQHELAVRQREIGRIADEGQTRRRGLFDRLAETFGRRDEPPAHPGREPQLSGQAGDSRARSAGASAPPARAPNVVAMQQPQIDPSLDDDQLEIPAFLRRQAN
jgi:cell division protein FtsZ